MARVDDRWCWAAAGGCVGVAVVTVGLTLRSLLGLGWPVAGVLGVGLVAVVVVAALGLVPALRPSGAPVLREVFVGSGLLVFVSLVYLVLVVGLDREAQSAERGLVALSLVSALVVALLALPVRSRLRDAAARIVPGPTVRSKQALDNLSARMTRAVPMDELLLQMAETLYASTAPGGAEVWVASEEALVRSVAVPDLPVVRLALTPEERAALVRARVSGNAWAAVWAPRLLAGRTDQLVRIAPITHLGVLLGALVVSRPAGARPYTDDDDSALAELARHTGLALHNVRLDSALQASLEELRHRNVELQASRARIVSAADESRRRIERDLHDGAQQHLVALAVRIGLARAAVDDDPSAIGPILDELRQDVQATLAELRTLAHGIYPPLLRDRGLGEALRNASTRAGLPVDADVELADRLPREIEAAVYFCCLEAITNAGKHAGPGASARVVVARTPDAVTFEVADDGAGFDPTTARESQGFVNMRDRVGAFGGTLEVVSHPGGGTTIRGRVPVADAPDESCQGEQGSQPPLTRTGAEHG